MGDLALDNKLFTTISSLAEQLKITREDLIQNAIENYLRSIEPESSTAIEKGSWLGCMKGTGTIVGDIVSPVEDAEAWDVLSR